MVFYVCLVYMFEINDKIEKFKKILLNSFWVKKVILYNDIMLFILFLKKGYN